MKAGTVYEVTLKNLAGTVSSKHRLAGAEPNPVQYLVKQACKLKFGDRIRLAEVAPYGNAVAIYRGKECVSELTHFEILKA